jgi:cytosine/adenosine deaminase-related metal-dependent hydrolase
MVTKAIVNGHVLTMNPDRQLIKPGSILIEDDQIAAIGASDTINIAPDTEVIDATGMAVLPGLINAHTHVSQILQRGGPSHDRDLYDWLFNVLYPGLAAYTPEDARVAAQLYCAEAIRSGITTIVDNEDAGQYESIAQATIESFQQTGIRAVYARMFFDAPRESMNEYLKSVMAKEPDVHHISNTESTDKAISHLENLIHQYHGTENGRISVWPAPSIPLVVSEKGLRESQRLAKENGTMWTLHLAESTIEQQVLWISPTEYLSNLGFLDDSLLAAHCIYVNERDIRMLRQHNVKVSTQVASNAYLGSGVAPIADMIALGLTIGIGTDDANCNDSVNLLSDMKLLAHIHRATSRDAAVLTPEKILEMATIDGAKAIGMEKQIGSLEVGKKADVILIDLNQPQMTPCHNIPAALVFQSYGNEVDTVIIDGEIVMRHRKLAFLPPEDEIPFYAKVNQSALDMLERAGIAPSRTWKTV